MTTVHEMQAHVANVAKRNCIQVKYTPWSPQLTGVSDPLTRRSEFPIVKGPISYSIALHELGHLIAPLGSIEKFEFASAFSIVQGAKTPWDYDLLVISEAAAWQWAVRNALVWTPEMTRSAKFAFGTYCYGMRKETKAYEKYKKMDENGFAFEELMMNLQRSMMRKEIERQVQRMRRLASECTTVV